MIEQPDTIDTLGTELRAAYQRLAELVTARREAVRFIARADKDIDETIAAAREIAGRLDAIAKGEQ